MKSQIACLENAQAQMDKAIEENDMVALNVVRELMESGRKKLEEASQYRSEQIKIRYEIESLHLKG